MDSESELWLIRGGRPVLWTMPARVRREKQTALGTWAVRPMFERMQRAMNERIKERGGLIVSPTEWQLPWVRLKTIGQRIEGACEIESLFSWERPRGTTQWTDNKLERDEFIDALYNQGIGTRLELVFWWNTFCNHALHWLVNEERPVDMYFLRLVPLPLRVDWLTKLWNRQQKGDPPDKLRRLLLSGFSLAYKRDGTCERHIEAQMTPMWWKLAKQVERQRMKVLGLCRYAEQFLQSRQRAYAWAMELYREWIGHSLAPPARLVSRGREGTRILAPNNRRARRRGKTALGAKGRLEALFRRQGRDGKRFGRRKNRHMLLLSGLRFYEKSLRKRWHRERRRRAAGLPVLPADQDAAPGQLLAGGADGGPGGLAARTEQLPGTL